MSITSILLQIPLLPVQINNAYTVTQWKYK
jgi:hypothetical protein